MNPDAADPDPVGVDADPDAAGHELLVRLAGRVPDRLLWRLREWLASGAHSAVAALLPRALLRNRVGLTDEERDLLETAVAGHAPRKLLDAVLTLTTADEPDVTFRPAPTADTTALCLLAVGAVMVTTTVAEAWVPPSQFDHA